VHLVADEPLPVYADEARIRGRIVNLTAAFGRLPGEALDIEGQRG
jgi:hypothetical protein